MNKCKVVIENVFGSLKNRWQILRHLNSKVDKRIRVTITCCVFRNFCEMWNEPKPRLANLASRKEYLVEFSGHMLPAHKDGEVTKAKEKY
jgi:hypothetical protein